MKSLVIIIAAFAMTACGSNKRQEPKDKAEETKTAPAGVQQKAPMPSLKEGLGFYTLDTPGIPTPVVSVASSVFLLKILGNNPSGRTLIDVTGDKADVYKKKILEGKEPGVDGMDKIVLTSQVDVCLKQDEEGQKNCIINTDIRSSTGFLAGDGTTLWTAAHSVEAFMNVVEEGANISKRNQIANGQRLAVYIFDKNSKLVLDPVAEDVKIKTAPDANIEPHPKTGFYREDADFISLSLSRSIGTPLKFATQKPALGQKLFVIGYPACTGCQTDGMTVADPLDFADRTPAPNSDGRSLRLSAGVRIDARPTEEFFDMKPGSFKNYDLERMVITTMDSQQGYSGAPLLNENGEVVAVHGGGQSKKTNGSLQRLSRASIPPAFGI